MSVYSQQEEGRCSSCGFLSKHPISGYASTPAPRFYEIESHERTGPDAQYDTMFFQKLDLAFRGTTPMDLVCFVGAADLMERIREIDWHADERRIERRDIALEVICLDRHCKFWYPYTAGFSPREHYDKQEMQRTESDRRAFELKLFELGQEAQQTSIQIAQDSKAVVSDLKSIAEKNDHFTRRVTLLVILLAIIQAVGQLLALPSVPWVQRVWHHFFR